MPKYSVLCIRTEADILSPVGITVTAETEEDAIKCALSTLKRQGYKNAKIAPELPGTHRVVRLDRSINERVNDLIDSAKVFVDHEWSGKMLLNSVIYELTHSCNLTNVPIEIIYKLVVHSLKYILIISGVTYERYAIVSKIFEIESSKEDYRNFLNTHAALENAWREEFDMLCGILHMNQSNEALARIALFMAEMIAIDGEISHSKRAHLIDFYSKYGEIL